MNDNIRNEPSIVNIEPGDATAAADAMKAGDVDARQPYAEATRAMSAATKIKPKKNKISNINSRKKKVDESNIVKFICSITEKKYSEADKYLQYEIDNRIRSKILKCLKDHE